MLPVWVHKSTKIITDFSIDKESLNQLGFKAESFLFGFELEIDRIAKTGIRPGIKFSTYLAFDI